MSSRQDRSKQKIIEQLPQYPIAQVACQRAGVSRATYYRWRQEDAEFAKDCDEAQKSGVGLINDLAESKIIAGINEGKPIFIFAWLNNHHPLYSDNRTRRLQPAIQELMEGYERTQEKLKEFYDDRGGLIEDGTTDEAPE